jgi:hypothetical protein
MSKPDYASLLAQIAVETDPTAKAALEAQCYQFPEPLTPAEEDLFAFVNSDYIQDNPGTTTSYIGVYYGDSGIIQ